MRSADQVLARSRKSTIHPGISLAVLERKRPEVRPNNSEYMALNGLPAALRG